MSNNMIAYCIATYNHPDVMDDVLKKCVWLYKKYDIDIYIYDSSTNDATWNIVKELLDMGVDNLFYVRLDSATTIDEKLIKIFQGYGLEKEYNYIWPIKDRLVIGDITLNALKEEINKSYDAIFLALPEHPYFGEEAKTTQLFYDNAGEFYEKWGWAVSSLDATIFNAKSLLKEINWEEFRERYFIDGENQFDHFAVLFHSLAQLEKCSVGIINKENIQFYSSPLGKSHWIVNTFKIWTKLWPMINMALPECYDKYKGKTIKRATTLPWLLGACDNLIMLKNEGVFTEDIWNELKNRWELLSDLSREEVECIISEQYAQLKDIILDKMDRLFETQKYKELYKLYTTNNWLSGIENTKRYLLLGECLKIYMLEMYANEKRTIFDGTFDYEEVYNKYFFVKYMLRRMEYDISNETWSELGDRIRLGEISSTFLIYVLNRVCINKEVVYNKLISVIEG